MVDAGAQPGLIHCGSRFRPAMRGPGDHGLDRVVPADGGEGRSSPARRGTIWNGSRPVVAEQHTAAFNAILVLGNKPLTMASFRSSPLLTELTRTRPVLRSVGTPRTFHE